MSNFSQIEKTFGFQADRAASEARAAASVDTHAKRRQTPRMTRNHPSEEKP